MPHPDQGGAPCRKGVHKVIHKADWAVDALSWILLGSIALNVGVCALTYRRFPWRRMLADHADRLAVLEDSLETVRSLAARTAGRTYKQQQRAGVVDADAEPDWKTDPEGWKAYTQRKIDARRKT